MRSIYFISPVGSDSRYLEKRTALAELEADLEIRFLFPLDLSASFDLCRVKADMTNAFAIIADLSLERPSCYFELGLAEAVGARVALIAMNGTQIHQTGCALKVRSYNDLVEYKSSIKSAILSFGQNDN